MQLSASEAGIHVDGLIALAEPVRAFFRWRPQLHHPGDELVLEAARTGKPTQLSRLTKATCVRRAALSGSMSFAPPRL
jgi:hypothetical protein